MPPFQRTPANVRISLISPESTIGLHLRHWWVYFIQIIVVGSEGRRGFETECVMALQDHPRSLILAPFDSAYASSYSSSIVTLVLSSNPIQSNEYNGSRPRPLFPSLSKNLKYKNTNKLLPLFRDIAGFLLIRATPPLFHPNFGVFPVD